MAIYQSGEVDSYISTTMHHLNQYIGVIYSELFYIFVLIVGRSCNCTDESHGIQYGKILYLRMITMSIEMVVI